MEWVWLCVAPPIQEMGLRGQCCTVAFLNVCAVWTCGFCVYKHGGEATPVLCRPIVLYGVCLQFRIVSHIYCHQYSRIVSSISAI